MRFTLLSCVVLAAGVLSAPLAPRCDDGCRSLDILGGGILSGDIGKSPPIVSQYCYCCSC